jgi:hypothetical protein
MLLFKENFHDFQNFYDPSRFGVRCFGHHLGVGAGPINRDVVDHIDRAIGLVRALVACL